MRFFAGLSECIYLQGLSVSAFVCRFFPRPPSRGFSILSFAWGFFRGAPFCRVSYLHSFAGSFTVFSFAGVFPMHSSGRGFFRALIRRGVFCPCFAEFCRRSFREFLCRGFFCELFSSQLFLRYFVGGFCLSSFAEANSLRFSAGAFCTFSQGLSPSALLQMFLHALLYMDFCLFLCSFAWCLSLWCSLTRGILPCSHLRGLFPRTLFAMLFTSTTSQGFFPPAFSQGSSRALFIGAFFAHSFAELLPCALLLGIFPCDCSRVLFPRVPSEVHVL